MFNLTIFLCTYNAITVFIQGIFDYRESNWHTWVSTYMHLRTLLLTRPAEIGHICTQKFNLLASKAISSKVLNGGPTYVTEILLLC